MSTPAEKRGLLLDTSFILPLFGVDMGPRVAKILKHLDTKGLRAYYSPFSLMEAVFVLIREVRRGKVSLSEVAEMAAAGAKNTLASLKRLEAQPEAYRLAIQMYEEGHHDLFDNLIYASAFYGDVSLLTLDEELIDFVKRMGLPNIAVHLSSP